MGNHMVIKGLKEGSEFELRRQSNLCPRSRGLVCM